MIGRTLFWYIFRDLLKIFLMANGALAGIMSFGGLLRPLTHQGLDMGQIARLLGCFNMAMLTYSMPIAALFATTVVYGRLSADNELTGCRAGGISHLSIALPAFVMGILVAILSLFFLCFVVPIFTLKAEQTLYSNLARLIAGKIQSEHEVDFGPLTIYAQEAYIPPPQMFKGQQVVVLRGPTIETIERNATDRTYHVPKDFYTASEAVIYIEQRSKQEARESGKLYMSVHLEDGMKFPRQFQDAVQASVQTTDYGPIEIDSPIKQDTKFMDVWRLKKLYYNPVQSANVKRVVDDLIERDEQVSLAQHAERQLNGEGRLDFQFGAGETYELFRDPRSPYAMSRGNEVFLAAPPPSGQISSWLSSQISADAASAAIGAPAIPAMPMGIESQWRPIVFQRRIEGQSPPAWSARQAHLEIRPSGEIDSLRVTLELVDAISSDASGNVKRKSFIQNFNVPTTGAVAKIAARPVEYYTGVDPDSGDRRRIGREVLKLSNQILAESNSRVSFAISCLVLVMVGCALGMMFRSGNFLSGFAVSFIPALVTITLIVAGQRVSGNVPELLKTDLSAYINTPLHTGLTLIWLGNCVNFVLAVGLLGRLQRK